MLPVQQSSAALAFLKMEVKVHDEGETVTLDLNGVKIDMHYEHAFDLSHYMRVEAGRLKLNEGYGRTIRSLGILTDASAKPKRLAPRPVGPSIHSKKKLQTWSREDVWAEGELVAVRIDHHTIRLGVEPALRISQHLRLHAKMCRNRAGDVRHWSVIKGAE